MKRCWWRAIWSKNCISANENPKIATAAPYRGRRGRDMDVDEVHFWPKTCVSASWKSPHRHLWDNFSTLFGTQFIINYQVNSSWGVVFCPGLHSVVHACVHDVHACLRRSRRRHDVNACVCMRVHSSLALALTPCSIQSSIQIRLVRAWVSKFNSKFK